ncbi:MAG: hypothetical protein ACI4PF_00065 [Christensenellales bacterium]
MGSDYVSHFVIEDSATLTSGSSTNSKYTWYKSSGASSFTQDVSVKPGIWLQYENLNTITTGTPAGGETGHTIRVYHVFSPTYTIQIDGNVIRNNNSSDLNSVEFYKDGSSTNTNKIYTIMLDGYDIGTLTVTTYGIDFVETDSEGTTIAFVNGSTAIYLRVPVGKNVTISLQETSEYFAINSVDDNGNTYRSEESVNSDDGSIKINNALFNGEPTGSTGNFTYTITGTSASGYPSPFHLTTTFDIYHKIFVDAYDLTTGGKPQYSASISLNNVAGTGSNITFSSSTDNYIFAYFKEGTLPTITANNGTSNVSKGIASNVYAIYYAYNNTFLDAEGNYINYSSSLGTAPSDPLTTEINTTTRLASFSSGLNYNILSTDASSSASMDIFYTVMYLTYITPKFAIKITNNGNSETTDVILSSSSNTVTAVNNSFSFWLDSACTISPALTPQGLMTVGGGFVTSPNLYYKVESLEENKEFVKFIAYSYSSSWVTSDLTDNPTKSPNVFGINHYDYYIANASATKLSDRVQYSAILEINVMLEINVQFRISTGLNIYETTSLFNGGEYVSLVVGSSTPNYTALSTDSTISGYFSSGKTLYITAKAPNSSDSNIEYRIVVMKKTTTNTSVIYEMNNEYFDGYYTFSTSTTTPSHIYATDFGFGYVQFSFNVEEFTAGTYFVDIARVYNVKASDPHTVQTYVSETGQNGDTTNRGSYQAFDITADTKYTYNGVSYVDNFDTVTLTAYIAEGFEFTEWKNLSGIGVSEISRTYNESNGRTIIEGTFQILNEVNIDDEIIQVASNYYTNIQLSVTEKTITYNVYLGVVDKNGIPLGNIQDLEDIMAKFTLVSDTIGEDENGITYVSTESLIYNSVSSIIGYFGNVTITVESQTGFNEGGYNFKTFATTGTNDCYYSPKINDITGYSANNETKVNNKTGKITIQDNTSVVNKDIIQLSAYFIYTYIVNIDVLAVGDTTKVNDISRFIPSGDTNPFTLSADGSYYRYSINIERGESVQVSLNFVVSPTYSGSTYKEGYMYSYILSTQNVGESKLTTNISGSIITATVSDIMKSSTIRIYYVPIYEIKINPVTEGRGTILTELNNTTFYYRTYDNATTTYGHTMNESSCIYAIYNVENGALPAINATLGGIESTISNPTSITKAVDDTTTTYIYVAMASVNYTLPNGSSTAEDIIISTTYRTTITPYIENSSDVYNRERYIPTSLNYYLTSATISDNFMVNADGQDYSYLDVADGINTNTLFTESVRTNPYSNVQMTTNKNYTNPVTGITTTDYVPVYLATNQGNHTITANFAREYTISISNYLSYINNGNFVTMHLSIGGEEADVTSYSEQVETTGRRLTFVNIHALASNMQYTTTLTWNNNLYEALYYEVKIGDTTGINASYQSLPITSAILPSNTDKSTLTNATNNAHYFTQYYMARTQVNYSIIPDYFETDRMQPVISITETTIDPEGTLGTSDKFNPGFLTDNQYKGYNIDKNNIEYAVDGITLNMPNNISTIVQSNNNTLTLF